MADGCSGSQEDIYIYNKGGFAAEPSGLWPASKPKAEEEEVTSAAHLRNLPSGKSTLV